MSRRIRSGLIRYRRGNVIVLAAVLMVVIFSFAAFSIDVGRLVVANAELQNAADAAAMSGASHLDSGPAYARKYAVYLAGKNDAVGQSVNITSADVELGIWNENTATFDVLPADQESSADAVRVSCSRTNAAGNPITLFFAGFLGQDTADVTVTSTARRKPSHCGLFVGIEKATLSGGSYTDSYKSSDGAYNPATAGTQGTICSNGDITLSSSSYINGDAMPGPGKSVSLSGSSYVTGSMTPRTEQLNYPPVDFGDSATNNDNLSIPLSDAGEEPYDPGNQEFKLSGGDHAVLLAGTYYFSKFTLSGGSSITVIGKTTIYCVGDFTASGSSIANLTQKPSDLQVFCTGGKVDISGGSHFYGVVYAPSSKIVRSSGSGHVFGSLIGKELTMSGGGGGHADESLTNFDGTASAVSLVQ